MSSQGRDRDRKVDQDKRQSISLDKSIKINQKKDLKKKIKTLIKSIRINHRPYILLQNQKETELLKNWA
jgi:hypothetical protein